MMHHLSRLSILAILIFCSVAHAANAPQSIAFRVKEWKRLRFVNPQDAVQQLETLKQLGCETQLDQKVEHTDVRFRATSWTKLSVESDDIADQWEAWLVTAGFETLHGHAEPPANGSVAVQYRLVRPRTMHVHDSKQAEELVAMFAGLGCTVQPAQDNGHLDLTVSCPSWHHLVFQTHDQAHAIQKWLDSQGFQTQHSH